MKQEVYFCDKCRKKINDGDRFDYICKLHTLQLPQERFAYESVVSFFNTLRFNEKHYHKKCAQEVADEVAEASRVQHKKLLYEAKVAELKEQMFREWLSKKKIDLEDLA